MHGQQNKKIQCCSSCY